MTTYTTWAAWNDEYIRLLKRRNKALRERDAVSWQANHAAAARATNRLAKAQAALLAHEQAERPSSAVMRNTIRS